MSDKMKNRYEVIECSVSAHCCFSATVIDNNNQSPFFEWLKLSICECFDVESANLVADALNRMSDD